MPQEQTFDKLRIRQDHITASNEALHIFGTYYLRRKGKKNFIRKEDKIIVPFSSVTNVSRMQSDHARKKAISLLLFLVYSGGALTGGKFSLDSLANPAGPSGDSLWFFAFITIFLSALAIVCLYGFLRLPGLPRRLFILHQAQDDLAFSLRHCNEENVARLEQLLKTDSSTTC